MLFSSSTGMPGKEPATSSRTQPVRVKKEPTSPSKKASKRVFQETFDVSDDDIEPEDEEQDVRTVARPAASSSLSVPVVEIPRRTRQSSITAKKAKKVRVERTPQQQYHDILQMQFQVISEAFQVIGKAVAAIGEE
jgi:hypothetical protein